MSGGTRTARVSFVSGLLSIAVTPTAPSVASGLTQQFKATGTFSDTSTADLTAKVAWTSGTPAIATIDATSGLATAVAVGSSVVTAALGSVSGSATLDVTAAVLESISITPAFCGVGFSTQLTATGSYSDGTATNVTNLASWVSSTPSVATVNPTTGLANGVSMGSTTITASVGSVTGSLALMTIANAWSPAASMSAARIYHTATLLQTSKVLVVGGSLSSSGEIYDPALSTWSAITAGPLLSGGHTATLLPNGKVLIAGGTGVLPTENPEIASAELYDPVANTWSSAGSMSTDRVSATATLLPNGKVLVAGGSAGTPGRGSVGLASAEVYDPVANTWSVVASMASARSSHTATLLENGLVLVAGGATEVGGYTTASTELYDPVANAWSSAGSLVNSRVFHTATLLSNGKVIVTGGSSSSTQCGCFATSEIYDPVTNAWSVGASMITARENHIAALLTDGTVLVAGGYSLASPVLASAEVYDPVADAWSATGSMSTARASADATRLSNGAVLIEGGDTAVYCGGSLACPPPYYNLTPIPSAELYWP